MDKFNKCNEQNDNEIVVNEVFNEIKETMLDNMNAFKLPNDKLVRKLKFKEMSNLNIKQVSRLIKCLCPSITDSDDIISSILNDINKKASESVNLDNSERMLLTKELFMENVDNNVISKLSIIDPYGKKISFFDNGIIVDSTPLGFVILGLGNIQSDFDYIDIRANLQAKRSIYINPLSVRDEFYQNIAKILMCSISRDVFGLLFNHPLVKSLYADRAMLRQLFSNGYFDENETYYLHTLFISNFYEILKEIRIENFVSKEGLKFGITKNITNNFIDNYLTKES